MNTLKRIRPLMLAAAMAVTSMGRSQVTTLGNNASSGDYVGCDNTSPFPLEIKHNDNQPIWIFTDAIWRATMNETVTYGLLGGFSSVPANGFTLLGEDAAEFKNGGAPGPYTMLHLAAATDNAQQLSYRPWMRTGVTFTGNADHGYVGQKGKELDYTDMIIHWSDNPGEVMKDRLRFLFTSGYNSAASGAESEEGLEFLRMWPNRYEDPHIGVGDFYAANLADPSITEPTERLDMVNGRLRIRDLPESTGEATGAYKVMVVDDAASGDERGVVKWVDPADLPITTDCDWELDPANNRMHTAWRPVSSTIDCPEEDWTVGIGIATPGYKLDVAHNEASGAGLFGGIRSEYTVEDLMQGVSIRADVRPETSGTVSNGTGVDARVFDVGAIGVGVSGRVYTKTIDGSATRMQGVIGEVRGPSDAGGYLYDARGVDGLVIGGDAASEVEFATAVNAEVEASSQMNHCYGVSSYVHGSEPSSERIGFGAYVNGYSGAADHTRGAKLKAIDGGVSNIGLWSEAYGTGAQAGYFIGDVDINGAASCTAMNWTSDVSLKTNVEDQVGGLEIIGQLRATTYDFIPEHPLLNLPGGLQRGFIAQEVEAILPDLVHDISYHAKTDSMGAVLVPAETIKTLNYMGIIPIIVAAMQEQQQIIEGLQQQLAATQAQVASCCDSHGGGEGIAPQSGGTNDVSDEKLTPAQERLLRIAPNPFTDRTTLYCTLERAGRMQLMANSSDGRDLRMLSEGQREAGEFQYEWSTEHLAPGVYYVTLLLDGEPVVKRAVKVGR